MGLVNKALGGGATFDYKGKSYTLSAWTYEVQAEFERYLEGRAVAAAQRLGRFLSPAQAESMMDKVLRDVAAGVYTFGTETVAQSLKSVGHLKMLTWIMLKGNHPEITKDQSDEMVDAQLGEVIDTVNRMNADPNSEGSTPEASQPPSS
jgi:hypothetical protein